MAQHAPPALPPKLDGETESLPGGGQAAAGRVTAGGGVPNSSSPVDPNTALEPLAPGGRPPEKPPGGGSASPTKPRAA